MRSLPLFLVACLASAQAPVQEPKAVVAYLYAHRDEAFTLGKEENGLSPSYFSPRLIKLYAEDRQRLRSSLDWDFMSNTMDHRRPESVDVRNLPSGDSDRASVSVRFIERKKLQTLEYDFIRQDAAWRIDEVRCPMKGNEWVLSHILVGKP